MSCYLRMHFSKTCNCLGILMQTSPICTCAVEAQGAIPTCEGSVPTNKDLGCHRELSAWYLIHNPVLNRGEDPKLQCVWHCATSPVFVCARDPFFPLLAHCSVINQEHLISMGVITNTGKGWMPLCWCQTLMASNFRVVARNLIISVISKEFKVVVKKKVPHHPGK